ncbi:MAG: 50S ribosomal protein L4 [bacterium]|nr:50S ribosomal protein L4 [bacterium]
MKQQILNFKKEKVSEITLNEDLSSPDVKLGSLYYKVMSENANIHQGTVFKKSRALVSGGGRKPYQQKHTGRARQGSIRAPHYKGGGRAFGNQRKNYKFQLPVEVKRNSRLALFNLKFKQDLVSIIEDFKTDSVKVKDFIKQFKNLINFKEDNILIVLDVPGNLKKAVRNIPTVKLMSVKRIKVIDLLSDHKIFMTKSAAEYLNKL